MTDPRRAAGRFVAPASGTRIEGQCPRCDQWFDADDWFDAGSPVPCCPDCGMVPARLAYLHGTGRRVERSLTVDVSRIRRFA
jgi:hypothetical protein